MLNKFENIDFYMITDSILSKNGIFSDVKNAIQAGCKIVQYREKNKPTRVMVEEAKKLKKICDKKAIFLINDRIDIALAVDSDGVHIGQDDMAFETVKKLIGNDKFIGMTVHNLEEAYQAEKYGVDYIGLAPIFETDTKEDALKPCGIEMILNVRKNIKIPIVAVGGINKKNVKDVLIAGADSVAPIKSILSCNDIYNEIKDFINIIGEWKK